MKPTDECKDAEIKPLTNGAKKYSSISVCAVGMINEVI